MKFSNALLPALLVAFSTATLLTGCSQAEKRETAKADPDTSSSLLSRSGLSKSGSLIPQSQKKVRDPEAAFDIAHLQERDGQYQKARTAYEQLVEACPDNAKYQHRLGVVCMQMGDTDQGLEHLRLAEVNSPGNSEILNDLGYACLLAGKYDLAQQVLLTALEANPNDQRATNNLGMAYGLSGDFNHAFTTFRRIMPEADAMSNLGYVATQVGRMDFAVECYSKALKADPTHQKAAEALVQVADLNRMIEQRRDIAKATSEQKSSGSGVIQTGGTSNPSKPE